MTALLVEIARWLGNKVMILLVIIGVLLASGWIAVEYVRISERLAQADATERVAARLETELRPLRQDRAGLETRMADLVKHLDEAGDLSERAAAAERAAKLRLEQIRGEQRWYFTKVTHAKYFARLTVAEQAHGAAARAARSARDAYETVRAGFGESAEGRDLVELARQIDSRVGDIAMLREKVAGDRAAAAAHPIERLRRQVRRVLPTALGILAVIILLPVVVKAGLYFLVAPWISRARPVVLLPDAAGRLTAEPAAVSVVLDLQPGDELVVHSDHLQAAGVGPGKRTRFLFSWRMPLTSLAAGLFLMAAVRSRDDKACRVTVAPKSDLFDKLARVTLPEGAAMVIYPRSLVGIVLRGGESPRITRHWRPGNLHSWITFQFRYLVLHGPCEFVVKGCRGVRAEEVATDNPRMQDQCATLGFTANLAYSAIRCETFVDYLRGRDGLFNDRFAGAAGWHFTEEIPDPRRKRGLFGRGIEGIIDGILKGFGI